MRGVTALVESHPGRSELARRGGQGPGRIEEIERGALAAEVHLGGVVGLDGSRLVPVGVSAAWQAPVEDVVHDHP